MAFKASQALIESIEIENCDEANVDLSGKWLMLGYKKGAEVYAGIFDSEAEARYRLDRLGSSVDIATIVQPEGEWNSSMYFL